MGAATTMTRATSARAFLMKLMAFMTETILPISDRRIFLDVRNVVNETDARGRCVHDTGTPPRHRSVCLSPPTEVESRANFEGGMTVRNLEPPSCGERLMEVIGTIAGMRERLGPHRRAGRRIGLVPTMGYLHAGHMELVRQARSDNDIVVASIFVNPLQFGANEDLSRYPRDLARDSAMLREGGVDYVFAPGTDDMYPRPMQTVVDVPSLGAELEGAVRPGHFAGVATVVTKLFNIVQPNRAYFGEKDFQQVTIVRRMVEDLSQPVEIVAVPTVRDADGVALSSRNSYLEEKERLAASILPRALDEAERLHAAGADDPAGFEAAIGAFISREPLATVEVAAVRDPETLRPLHRLQGRPVLVALFVRIGTTRLLDNRVIGSASGNNRGVD
jgi:pantoate--beta-alanine ligase